MLGRSIGPPRAAARVPLTPRKTAALMKEKSETKASDFLVLLAYGPFAFYAPRMAIEIEFCMQ
jgi:hypothetical protein